MTTVKRWLGFLMTPLPGAIVLYVLEFLIQYMWLGRDLPFGRMWANLIIVTGLIIAGFTGLVYFLAYHFELHPVVWFWLGWMALFVAGGPAINAVCSQPAINWGTGQQFAFGAGAAVIAGFYLKWALSKLPLLESNGY